MTRVRLASGAALLLLAACAAPRPTPPPQAPSPPRADVSYHAVADEEAPRYKVEPNQTAIAPTTGPHNRAPVYPPQLVPLKLPPVQVRARIIVDAHGRVTQASVPGEDTARPATRAFDAAVRQAVLQWTFDPLRMTTWKDMPDGTSKRVADKPMPFSQDYVFTFSLRDGKPVVSTGSGEIGTKRH